MKLDSDVRIRLSSPEFRGRRCTTFEQIASSVPDQRFGQLWGFWSITKRYPLLPNETDPSLCWYSRSACLATSTVPSRPWLRERQN